MKFNKYQKYLIEVVEGMDLVSVYDAADPERLIACYDDVDSAVSGIREDAINGKDALISVVFKKMRIEAKVDYE